MWIPFIWIALAASRPLTSWLTPGVATAENFESALLQGNSAERNYMIILLVAGALLLLKRRDRITFYFKDNVYIYLLYFYALVSIVWSAYPGISAKRYIRLVGDIIMALLILSEDRENNALDHILRRCAIFLIPMSMLFVRFLTQYGIGYSRDGFRTWTGVTTNKNSLGMLCAFLGTYLIWRILKNWPRFNYVDSALLLMTLYLLWGSRSTTSLLVLLMGTALLILGGVFRGQTKKMNRWVLALLLFFGIMLVFGGSSFFSVFLKITAKDSSFTGRIPLWTDLLQIGIRNPLTGSGYASFWPSHAALMWRKYNFLPIQSHNGYIDVFLDLGLAGFALLLYWIIQTYRNILKDFERKLETSRLMLAFFIMVIFHNIMESTLIKPFNLLWMIFLLSSIVMVRKPESAESSL